MIAKQVTIKKGEVPHGWSLEAADFINKVLNMSSSLTIVSSETTRKSARSKRSRRSQTTHLVQRLQLENSHGQKSEGDVCSKR